MGTENGGTPGLATRRNAQRGLSARHLVLGADDGGGAGEAEAEDDDREGGDGVEDAVHLDRHDLVPFLVRLPVAPIWVFLAPVRSGRCLDSTYLNIA